MSILKAAKSQRPRDAFQIMVLSGLERITTGLQRGDEFDLRDLEPMVNRMRPLITAFDKRKAYDENN